MAIMHRTILAEILEERVVSSRGRRNPRGVKRKMTNYNIRTPVSLPTTKADFAERIKVIK